MPNLTISLADSIMSRYGSQLVEVGSKAPIVLLRALNHEGDKAKTQVKRSLVRVTGIKHSLVDKGLSTLRASQGRLAYTLVQRSGATNLGLFNARQTATGVSATPWGQRHLFPHAFIIARYGGKVFIREAGSPRLPIRPLYGPDLGKEIAKGEPAQVFRTVMEFSLADRVCHELGRLLEG